MASFKSLVNKPLKNIFILISIGFVLWMLFWDSNSWLIHRELNKHIETLENQKAYYKKEIERDKKAMEKLSAKGGIEKFARETYHMKRKDEDLYIIEYKDRLNP